MGAPLLPSPLLLVLQYGDLAQTTTDFGHDEKRRLSTVQTYRGPPAAWTNAPENYSPAPDYGGATPSTFQLILEDGEFSYDVIDNPTAIHDWRNPAEWPSGAKPVSRSIQYDDLSRVTRVDYQYAAGDDNWTDPFAAEDTGASTDPRRATPSPHVSFDKRSLSQTFAYDWLGNTSATGDDAGGFYDRSLGDITNASATGKPYQLAAASNEAGGSPRAGHLTTVYDDAGNLRSMAVNRAGPCVPSASLCGQRYAYDWDEVGQLKKARRWDVADPGNASDALPEDVPAVELHYAYDGGGQRVLKTAQDTAGAQVHTVYALGSVELRRAPFQDGDYVDDHTTEVGYLSAHGVRLARLHYAEGDLPSLSSGHLHVLLEMPDHLGSSSIVVDRETSELVERSTYLAPGTADSDYRSERWDSFREDYRFTGKEEDSEVGLAYFGARYLAPSLARWISADPLAVHALGADLNVYAYVGGRLLSATDPLGLAGDPPPDPSDSTMTASYDKVATSHIVVSDDNGDLKASDVFGGELCGGTCNQKHQTTPSTSTEAGVRPPTLTPGEVSARQNMRLDVGARTLGNDAIGVLQFAALDYNPIAPGAGRIFHLQIPTFSIPTVADRVQQSMLDDSAGAAHGVFLSATTATPMGFEGVGSSAALAFEKMPGLVGLGMVGGELTSAADVAAPAVEELVPSLRPDRALGSTPHPFEGVPKAMHPQMFDVIEDLQAARAGDTVAAGRIAQRNPHVLTGDLKGWTSIDIAGRDNSLRLLYKSKPDGIEWMVRNTHR